MELTKEEELRQIAEELKLLVKPPEPDIDYSKSKGWLKDALWRQKNRNWLNESHIIAGLVLEALDERGWSQADLAKKMGVSRQAVNKYVRGSYNFTLMQKHKLQDALGIELNAYKAEEEFKAEMERIKAEGLDISTMFHTDGFHGFEDAEPAANTPKENTQPETDITHITRSDSEAAA
ncbi:MAG: helix-turn-helix transcriptional regulator [Bacteroidota bacterium]